eukprot:554396-Rhodomonas_salina.2
MAGEAVVYAAAVAAMTCMEVRLSLPRSPTIEDRESMMQLMEMMEMMEDGWLRSWIRVNFG